MNQDSILFGNKYEFNTKNFYKILLISASLLYLAFGVFFNYFENYHDPMTFYGRLIDGSLFFIVFLVSFFNTFVDNHLKTITHGITYIVVGHLAYLTYSSGFQFNLSISLLIVIAFVNLIFESTFYDLIFNGLVALFILISLIQLPNAPFSKTMYLFIYCLMASITYFTSYQNYLAKREMKDTNDRLEVAIKSANLGIWQWNISTDEVEYDDHWLAIFNFKSDDLTYTRKDFNTIVHPDDQRKLIKEFAQLINGEQESYQTEYRINDKFNQIRWIRSSAKVIKDEMTGEVNKILGADLDITEQKNNEMEIKKLLYKDELTDLYNRRYLNNEINKFKFSRQYPISIIIGDLDRLKSINDQYGHLKGDHYLETAGKLIKNSVRTEDIAARLGGDEFAILLPNTNERVAEKICKRIHEEFKRFNAQKSLPEALNISLGTSTVHSKNENIEKAFIKADDHMYKNKRR